MRVFIRRIFLLLLMPGIIASFAQDNSNFKNAVTWREIAPKTDNLSVGDVIEITLEATVGKGFHLYSAKQPSDAVLPAIFELDKTSTGVQVVGGLQEKGNRHVLHDEIFDADIAQYEEGKVTFIQKLKVTAPDARVEGALRYQVCDDQMCIPDTREISRTFKAKGAAIPATVVDTAATKCPCPCPNDTASVTQTTAAPAASSGSNSTASASGSKVASATGGCDDNLWLLFLECLGLGLIAVLTPCVFPMIPLTVSIFTKRKAKTRAEGIRNALTYAGSIVFIFTFLGLLLALIFGPNVLTDMANNPWFNVFFFALLAIFGLSFLGWFELTLPASWSTKLTVEGNKRGGFLGIFMLAGALTVVSFACTGPMVSTALLGATEHACFSSPIVAMLGFSLGLAFPFGFFAFAPSALSALPSSGGWLNTVKVIMGIGEIALAMTYLSGADMVMHWGLLDREIFLGIWMVLFSLLGMNILGKLPLDKDDPVTNISVPRLILAGISFAFVLYMLPGLFGARLPMINGFLPPVNKDMVVIGAGGTGGGAAKPNDICGYPNKILAEYEEHTPPGFCTFYDIDQAKAYAQKAGKPLFVDFTGFNCKNCRLVEGQSWVDPQVQKMLNSDYVMVSLYNDDGTKLPEPIVLPDGSKLRTLGDKIRQYQIENFHNNGAPYYVLMTADGKVLDQMGYDGSGSAYTATLATFLKKGLGKN